MPARPPLVADPPLPVVQGDQLLSSVLPTLGLTLPYMAGDQPPLPFTQWPLVPEQRVVASIVAEPVIGRGAVLTQDCSLLAANAGIATPCGEWVPMSAWRVVVLNPFTQATTRFAFVGVTRDGTGAALGNCTVRSIRQRDIATNGIESEVSETVSDGSGNYTLYVGGNDPHQLVAYLAGSPDRAGVSANTVVPDAVG